MLTRLGRQADIEIVYCVTMEKTLAGNYPVVPSYMAGYELLSANNRDGMLGGDGDEENTDCNHPTTFSSNGNSLVDYSSNHWCKICNAKVSLDVVSCQEACCCHDQECNCCSNCLKNPCICALSSTSKDSSDTTSTDQESASNSTQPPADGWKSLHTAWSDCSTVTEADIYCM